MTKPIVMVPVYCGGHEFMQCLHSLTMAVDCFEHVYLSFNGPSADSDQRMADEVLEPMRDRVTFLRTPRTMDFIPHFIFYVQSMQASGVRPDDWVMMLQHDDWLLPENIRGLTMGGSQWDLSAGSLYLGPWQVYWEPAVEKAGGIDHIAPELISALYDEQLTSLAVGDWIAREFDEPYYINTTGAIAQFRHWKAIADVRPSKPGGMRFEMTLACSPGVSHVRQFPRPLVGVMARPDSERERYSTWEKRKDDLHFLYWASRNWMSTPSNAIPALRALPRIASRSIRHTLSQTRRLN